MFFFFKQKTAYEVRISDWSSDVCSSDLEVVAPPISSGITIPARVISSATVPISSSDGVISPDRPIMSASLSLADFRISLHGTITQRSITSKQIGRAQVRARGGLYV